MNGYSDTHVAAIKAYLAKFDLTLEETTCFTCSHSFACKCAFDPYNTDGDCLMEK